jgi:ABC-type branched-subunit amino acid transport system permease subunit
MYAHLIVFISPLDFNFCVSINILLMVIIGETSSISVAILGANGAGNLRWPHLLSARLYTTAKGDTD